MAESYALATVATLRQRLQLATFIRAAALRRGDRALAAAEDERIARLARHLANLEALRDLSERDYILEVAG